VRFVYTPALEGPVDVERFQGSPVGHLTPIDGHDAYLDQDYSHYAFVPDPLPSVLDLQQDTYNAVTKATLALGRLDFAVRRLPDPRMLVGPVLRREAQSTSELEGTFTTLDEVLAADFIEASRQSAELREVMNYVAAAEKGFELIKTLPICARVLCELQRILVRGTRAEMYDSGQLRHRQVFIGERELGIENSRFVPVPPGELLKNGVSDWEKWINKHDDEIPLVVKAAIGHYQFETLHPFSDGNGRLGRLAVVLQLMEADTLAYPVLNLSPWLKVRKDEYKALLQDVSATGNYDAWVRFFATAIEAQAADMVQRVEELLTVREELLQIVRDNRRYGFIVEIIEDLIGYPSLTPSSVAKRHQVQYKTANDAFAKLEQMGILRESSGVRYGRIFICPRVRRIVSRP
jgi:Fic family protein